jgi:hypothetical protein
MSPSCFEVNSQGKAHCARACKCTTNLPFSVSRAAGCASCPHPHQAHPACSPGSRNSQHSTAQHVSKHPAHFPASLPARLLGSCPHQLHASRAHASPPCALSALLHQPSCANRHQRRCT